MAATPIAMADAGRSIDTSTLVIEAHIVAMYLPSLFSGNLVRRFTPAVMLVPGTLLLLLGSAVLFVSTSTLIFFAALIIIGLGWNFSYVSASSLLLLALKSPLEKPLGQGMFDAIALGGLSVAVITSGFTFDGLGWRHMYTVRPPPPATRTSRRVQATLLPVILMGARECVPCVCNRETDAHRSAALPCIGADRTRSRRRDVSCEGPGAMLHCGDVQGCPHARGQE